MGLFDSLRGLKFWGKQKDGTYFYPLNGFSTRMIGFKGEDWIDTCQQVKVFDEIPELNLVVTRAAAMHSNVCWKVVDPNGDEVDQNDRRFKPLYDLLKRPNPLQKQNLFIEEGFIQECLFGNQYTYKNHPSRVQDFPSALWNISPAYMAPYRTGNVFDQTEIQGIISHYVYEDGKTKKQYATKDVLHRKNANPNDPVMGVSPLLSIALPLSNLRACYKYLNKAYSNSGALGMISAKGKNGSEGSPALLGTEKKRIMDEHLSNYGIEDHQSGVWITEAGLEFTPFGYPIRQMAVFENLEHNKNIVCDNYGIDAKVLSSKGTKFDDKVLAYISTYQDTIQPKADAKAQDLTGFLMPEKYDGFKIVAEFTHIATLKRARKQGQEGFKQMSDAVNTLVAGGIWKAQEAKDVMDAELESLKVN